MKVNLNRALCSLARALDFLGVDEVHHGKRTALMAATLAAELGWDAARRAEMLRVGLIHDCGVSRTQERKHLTETLEWEGAQEHCLRGEAFLLACPPLARFATVVLRHHTRWEDLLKLPLSNTDRESANLLFLVDRVDALAASYFTGQSLTANILSDCPHILDRISKLSGRLFAPEFVEAFRRTAEREAFWLALEPAYIDSEIEDALGLEASAELDAGDALALAGLFAHAIDAKSNHTLEHSARVARIARYLAEQDGIAGEDLDKIEIAGLLHDIGKLRMPELIIDKAGELSPEERAVMMRHSFDTGHILRDVFPGEPIADWASLHHENLLGTGYPFHHGASAIPREARLIAIADIFQALCQDRPYRGPLGCIQVFEEIEELLAQGCVDGELVELLRANLEDCYSIAVD
ncbi:MAG: HD domain-containing protein [Acidobacteriota bacterium]|nr:HD domain-containing protein [Acidobacteriota bacterium]